MLGFGSESLVIVLADSGLMGLIEKRCVGGGREKSHGLAGAFEEGCPPGFGW